MNRHYLTCKSYNFFNVLYQEEYELMNLSLKDVIGRSFSFELLENKNKIGHETIFLKFTHIYVHN